MNKHLLFSAVLTVFTATAFSQQQQQGWCASDAVLKQQLDQDPGFAAQREQFEIDFREYLEMKKNRHPIDPTKKLIIPVVFHVIHEGGSENISKAQIEDQIRILNECFNHQNSDSVNTPAPFLALAGTLNVEFRLAKKDPMGNCTEGINRIFSNKTNTASNQNGVKALSYWNSYSYLNFWIVKSIENFTEFGSILGYAQFPGSGMLSTDGVVMLHSRTGSIGTASSSRGRTAVHEVGHWLNLIHIWGDQDCGSDQVNDTPPAFGPNFTVCYNHFPYFPADTCDNTYPYGEMMVNYMDYSDDNCQNMFTIGQCERMRFVLEGNSGNNGIRSFLVSEENLWATGTHDDYTGGECAPIADFTSNRQFICAGANITFTNASYNGPVTQREWSFPGGTPEISTANAPNVTYNTPGVYPVTLTVSNGTGTNTITKTSYVYVSDTYAQNQHDFLYFEDFENITDLPSGFVVVNPDNTNNKWELAGGLVSPSGGGALRVNNFGNTRTEYEELITPAYNLSNLQSQVVMRYKYSGATRTYLGEHDGFTVTGDAFKVFFSTNCGQSWTQIPQLALSDNALINAGQYTQFYVPNASSIWSEKQANIPAGASGNSNVMFKFRYEVGSGHGNNFYIDGIRIENITGVEELTTWLGVNVFPNPSNGITRISLNTPETGNLLLNLMDITGRQVAVIHNGRINSGEQTFMVDVNSFSAGIYFLQINFNDRKSAMKLMVE